MIYYAVVEGWRAIPIFWVVVLTLTGFGIAKIIPIADLVSTGWDEIFVAHKRFWVSTAIGAIGVAVLLAFLRRGILDDREQEPEPPRDLTTPHHLLDDVAIRVGETDELERQDFADKLAPLLVLKRNSQSVVVSIEAGWGEGKSSVLSLTMGLLKRHVDRPIVVQFNPWFVDSREQVLRSFFSQLIQVIGSSESRASDAVQRLRSYARTLEVAIQMPIGAALGSALEERLAPKTLLEEKSALAAALDDVDRPIVVVVDDIDRLPAEDIRCIFQLIKIVCDFNRVSYLLAFDPEPIDKALRFGGLYRDGKLYREKIVQLNLQLPRPSFPARHRFFRSRLDQRVEAWKLELDSGDRAVIETATPLVVQACVTPRELKRLLNAWCLACDMLREEVNFGDVLLMEVLAMRFPKVFAAIEMNPRAVSGTGVFSFELGGSEAPPASTGATKTEREKRRGLLESLLQLHPKKSEYGVLEEILTILFPDVIKG